MEFRATKPIGLMAVVVNEAKKTAEAIPVDTLRLMSFFVNYSTQQMLFAFAWGGYDSQERFHMDPNRQASHRSIQANVKCNLCASGQEGHEPNCEAAIWQACAICPKGNPLTEFNESFMKKVLVEHRKIHDVIHGAWVFQELELTHNGETVLKTNKSKT